MAPAREVPMFDSCCTKLWRGRPPSLLQSGSSSEASALTWPNFIFVYFVPLQKSMSQICFSGFGREENGPSSSTHMQCYVWKRAIAYGPHHSVHVSRANAFHVESGHNYWCKNRTTRFCPRPNHKAN